MNLRGEMSPAIVRERSEWYAETFLVRLLGQVAEPTESNGGNYAAP